MGKELREGWAEGVFRPSLRGAINGPLAVNPSYRLDDAFDGTEDGPIYCQRWDVIHIVTGFAMITGIYKLDDALDFADKAVAAAVSEIANMTDPRDSRQCAALGSAIKDLLKEYGTWEKRDG